MSVCVDASLGILKRQYITLQANKKHEETGACQ